MMRLRPTGAKFVVVLALIVSAQLSGQTQRASAPESHANPQQSDPALEVARLRNEGSAHYESGIGLKKALAAFEAALRLKPQSAIELFNLGTTHRKMGNTDKAIDLLTRSQQLDPNLTHAAYTLGLVQRGRGDTQGAIAAFEAARKSAPTQAAVHYQLGRLYRETGREPQALQSYIDALQLDPQHPGTMYQLYLYYQEHGEPDRAKSMFEEFSRVKRALSVTRKEINDDETRLAQPLIAAAPHMPQQRGALKLSASKVGTTGQVASVALRDIDADGLDDLVTAARDGTVSLHHNEGKFQFVQQTSFKPSITGAIHSATTEILVRGESYRLLIGTADGLYLSDKDLRSPGSAFTRISKVNPKSGLAYADIDHDGDVDLIVGAFADILLNDGAGAFKSAEYFPAAARKQLQNRLGPVVAADMLDRNGIDFVLHTASGERVLIADELGGRHSVQAFAALKTSQTPGSVVAADLDNDGRTDFVSSAAALVQIDYHQDRYRFTPATVSRTLSGTPGPLTVGDFDSDGWKDLLELDAASVRWHRNLGARKLDSQSPVKALSGPAQFATAADIDRDGRLDLLVLLSSGDVEILKNETPSATKAMRLVFEGIRSAPSGLHTIVETRRGNFYQKYVSRGGGLDLPLGQEDYAEVVRINWPNGFVESKLKVDGGQVWRFKESERVSGSCPSVFTWDGSRFRFVSDAFISGPMGVPFGAGYFPVDHDEYLKIPGEYLRPDKGRLRVAITEELREAVFLDRVRLLAVDHPADTEAYPNEFLQPGVFPAFKVHLTTAAKAPRSALDHAGRDVTALVSTVDRRYPTGFRRLQYEGLAEENGVEIELPEGAALASSLRLFLTGWFHYFESTSLVAASQRSDLRVQFPRIEVLDRGEWRKVLDIGIPSGKDKTVVADLTHRLPPYAQKIRVRSNLALYWDRIAIDASSPPSEVELAEAGLRSARLRFKGFSAFEPVSAADWPQPERFVYGPMRVSAPWNPLAGKYTRYGPVEPLMQRVDSQMTVFGSGDEVLLEFDARALPALKPGWRRDYLLHLDGFVKDGDKYTAHAGTLEPLPFAGMKRYPYEVTDEGAEVFTTPAYRAYLKRYQTRAPLRFTGFQLVTEQLSEAGPQAISSSEGTRQPVEVTSLAGVTQPEPLSEKAPKAAFSNEGVL